MTSTKVAPFRKHNPSPIVRNAHGICLTAPEAAKRLGISYSQVLRQVRAGQLLASKRPDGRLQIAVTEDWPPENVGRLVDAGYVAKALKVTRRAINYWAHSGHLEGYKTPGGEWRFPISEVERLKVNLPSGLLLVTVDEAAEQLSVSAHVIYDKIRNQEIAALWYERKYLVVKASLPRLPSNLMTTREFATAVGTSIWRVQQWAKRGDIKGYRVSYTWRFSPLEIQRARKLLSKLKRARPVRRYRHIPALRTRAS